MLPKRFKPAGTFELIRLGGDHDGGYLVDPKSIQESSSLLALGIGRNWSCEEDFIEKKRVKVHAYDYSIASSYWIKHFFKRLLSILIGRFTAPFKAIRLYLEFKEFFKSHATLFLEKIGTAPGCDTNLNQAMERLDDAPIFLKVDIEGYEYQILDEIVACSDRLSGLVIEFHLVSKNKEKIEKFLTEIKLELIHIHPNNNRLDDEGDPKAIELSFSRSPIKVGNRFMHPHELDQDNVPRKEAVDLRFSEI